MSLHRAIQTSKLLLSASVVVLAVLLALPAARASAGQSPHSVRPAASGPTARAIEDGGAAAAGARIRSARIAQPGPTLDAAVRSAQTANSGFYIRGGGFGHDIGMSQYGAAGYAQHGWSFSSILEHYYTGTTVTKLGHVRYVTVLISQGSQSFHGATSIRGSRVRLNPNTTYSVWIAGNRLELAAGGRVLEAGGRAITFGTPLTVSAAKMVYLTGHGWYRGSLQFRFGTSGNGCAAGGAIAAVNLVGLNDYVRGVVTEESPASWPQQALDAQAVAARTYALSSGSVNPGRWMLYANTCSQMYGGVAGETRSANAAVNATYNDLVELHGRPVTTYFFSSSGGHTKSILFSWGISGDSWLQGVDDPYDDSYGNPYHSWGYNVSLARVQGQLADAGYLRGSLRDIRVNPNNLQIVGSRGTVTTDGANIESLFGTLSPNMVYTTMWDHAGRVGGSRLGIWGTILPGDAGARVTAQRWQKGGWKALQATFTAASGAFHMSLRVAGRYRIVYHNIPGPGVDVGS